MSTTKAPLPGLAGRGVGVRGPGWAIPSATITGIILNDQTLSPERPERGADTSPGQASLRAPPWGTDQNKDLPCKGNGTVNTVSLSFHWTREEHCVTEDGHAVAQAIKTGSRVLCATASESSPTQCLRLFIGQEKSIAFPSRFRKLQSPSSNANGVPDQSPESRALRAHPGSRSNKIGFTPKARRAIGN